MIAAADLRFAAEALVQARWALLGDCAVVSRCVHGHGAAGDAAVGVYLGMDAGQNLYGLQAAGQVLHVDVLHSPGLCSAEALRARLRTAARRWLRDAGDPTDETQRLLRWVEARADAQDPMDVAGDAAEATETRSGQTGTGAGGRTSGHVHLALHAAEVPLEFLPVAVEAVEDAIADSGLDLLPLVSIDPTWETSQRPPCACGTAGGAPAAGAAGGMRRPAARVAADLSGGGLHRTAAEMDRALGSTATQLLQGAHPLGPVAEAELRRRGLAAARRLSAPAAGSLPQVPAPSPPPEPEPEAMAADSGIPQTAWARSAPPRPPGPRPQGDAVDQDLVLTAEGRAVRRYLLRRLAADAPAGGVAAGAAQPGAGAARAGRRRAGGGGVLLPVETAAAAARAAVPVRPTRADVRYAAPRSRRRGDAVVALDRSASLAGRLGQVRLWAAGLACRHGRVGVYELPLQPSPGTGAAPRAGGGRGGPPGQPGPAVQLVVPPTRDRRALGEALDAACRGAGGQSDLGGGLRALAEYLRASAGTGRRTCYVVTDGLATGDGDAFAEALASAATLRAIPRLDVAFCGWHAHARRLRALGEAAEGRVLFLGD